MNVRISVVIPGYNTTKAMWDRCLGSVLGNLGPDDEVICVDDASTANSSFLDDWARQDARVRIVRQLENGGQAVARNRGMDLARGEWLAFVDSDDEVMSGIYDDCLSVLETSGADVAVYGVKVVWPDNGQWKEDLPSLTETGPLSADDVRVLCRECLVKFPWNKVFRRSFLVQNGIRFIDRAAPREDEIFNVDCVVSGARWCAVRRVGHIYYHGYSSSLGRYRRYEEESDRAVNDAWRRLWTRFGRSDETFGISDEIGLKYAAWRNLWRPGSPFSLVARWSWLKSSGLPHPAFAYLKMMVFMALRRWCYVRPLRRANIRRLYPEVRDVATYGNHST